MRIDLDATFSGARLLLVDDDEILSELAAQTLRHAGFTVTLVNCGEEALRLFEHEQFDLVLLDVMMPGLDGFEVCTQLRGKPHGASIPILMLTGLNDTDSIEAAFRCGASDFVTKPINWTLLSHRVRYSLRAKSAVESVSRGSERLARAQRLANMGSWEWSPATGEFVCSDEIQRIFAGAGPAASVLSPAAFLAQVCAADRDEVGRVREAAATAGQSYQLMFSIQRRDGQKCTVFEQAVAVKDTFGQIVKVEGITQDITERVDAERQIHQLAFYDSVTGLPNRKFFNEMAQVSLDRSRRLRGTCAVLHLDLDRFKSVNDAFGTEGGDQILQLIAERLQASIRGSDLAGASSLIDASELVARIGGNSFVILLVDLANSGAAATVAARLLGAVARPLTLAGREVLLTASIGIALFPRDGDDVLDLSQKAEQAVYVAKAAGRATHRFFDQKINAVLSGKLALATDLRRSIGAGELRLFFQPKVNARNGMMLGAEVLVRWQHPQRGIVSPGDFIPLAEEFDLIVPIGDWVLQTACEALQRWRCNGISTVPLSVNMSSSSFLQVGLVAQLDEMVSRYGLDAPQLTLEITESVLMTNTEHTIARLQALRDRGFGLSLDDFGTGYSSLSYLKRLPIDELKIDRSFVRDLTKGGRDTALVGSIIELGRQFGLGVIAEGVETEAQAGLLINRGCLHQQGFLFARPMPLNDFEHILVHGTTFNITRPQVVTAERFPSLATAT
jgi:diguanylate cyclase (GGDEF)-like protein